MLYIAYGSNINPGQMAHRCPGAKVAGVAELEGHDLLFKGRRYSAVATIEPLDGGAVPVLLWSISKTHEQALDAFEGWPHVYRKEIRTVQFEGEACQGMLYIMNGAPFGYPSARYYNTIREGYKSAGLDTGYLDRAVERSMRLALEQDVEREMAFSPKAHDEQEFDDGQQNLFEMRWW